MKKTIKCLVSLLFVALIAIVVAGCTNPFVDSWSGETIDDALITFEDKTYDLSTLQKMKVPAGDYRVIVGSPNHHSIETLITLGSRDVPEIPLTPTTNLQSFCNRCSTCPALDIVRSVNA